MLKLAEKQDCESFSAAEIEQSEFEKNNLFCKNDVEAFEKQIKKLNQQKSTANSKKTDRKKPDNSLSKFKQQYFDRYDDVKQPCKFVKEDW